MMSGAELPLWAAIAVSFFLLLGATLALLGAVGFLRFSNFYERLHPPGLIASWGTGATVTASILYFSITGGRPVIHELLVGIFVTLTMPVTSMLLGRAALHRDRAEGNPGIPMDSIPYPILDEKPKAEPDNA